MLTYNETKILIELVLGKDIKQVRLRLYVELQTMNSKEGEFYESVATHGPFIGLTSDQWLDLLTKFPNQIFWSQISIDKVLSEEQRKRLPPVTG
jgi:hypothetical protein